MTTFLLEATITDEFKLVQTEELSLEYKVGLLKQIQAYLMDLVEKRSEEEARIRDKKGTFTKQSKIDRKLRDVIEEVHPLVEETFVIFKEVFDVVDSDERKAAILKKWLGCETDIPWDGTGLKISDKVFDNAMKNGYVSLVKLTVVWGDNENAMEIPNDKK